MANEITINLTFGVNNTGYKDTWQATALSLTQNALGASAGIANTTTVAANLDYGAVVTGNVGFVLFKNLDSTNAVDVGRTIAATFYQFARVLPGEHAMFRVTPSIQLQLQAVAGTPQVQFWLLQA